VYRQAILDAAMRVFGRTGFRDTKMAQIASEAGVATGTLYNYYSSKEDIFESILENGEGQIRAAIQQAVAAQPPVSQLRAIVRVMLEHLEQHGSIFIIYMQLDANSLCLQAKGCRDEAFRREMFSMIEQAIIDAGPLLRTDFSPQTLATAIGGLLSGAIMHWIDAGCPPGLHAQADTIMDLFLNGASQR